MAPPQQYVLDLRKTSMKLNDLERLIRSMRVVRSLSTILNWIITSSLVSGITPNKDFLVPSVLKIYGLFVIQRKSRLVCIEIIDSTDVFVHIHRENATCRTRVYLVANRNPCKSDHSFRVEYTNFVKNSIIVNPHHLLPLSVQIVLWMILIVCDRSVFLVSLFGIVYTSLIDLWVLKLIFDLSLSVDCSPGGAELSEKPWAPAFMLSFTGGRFALHSWTSILALS